MKIPLLFGVLALMTSFSPNAEELPASLREDGQYRNQVVLPKDGFMKKLRIGIKYLLLSKPAGTARKRRCRSSSCRATNCWRRRTTASGGWGTPPCC